MSTAVAQTTGPDENFMLVLREVEGANKQNFGFAPAGPSRATLNNGALIELKHAWFNLIGDMHVRFVIDGEHSMRNVTSEEFEAFDLTAEDASDIAIRNIKARYGAPSATHWDSGIMLVAGESPDFDSSYLLDRTFWDGLLLKHPEGVIVGVPKRGGLIYAPRSDKEAVESLERSIQRLFETSENKRVSSALYMYKDGLWTVHQNPVTQD